MLILIAWATFVVHSHAVAGNAISPGISVQVQQQDTAGSKRTTLPAKDLTPRQHPPFRQTSPYGDAFGPETQERQFGRLVDSLFRSDPQLKAPLLRELLIPSVLPAHDPKISELDSLHQQLIRASHFSTFERMGLIARHYSLVNPNPKSFSTHQIDIIGTIIWLNEVLK